MSVAVVGAGIAGLRAAALLVEKTDVVMFEKSRGYGGRMATRRAGPFSFDHGAQYFRARHPEFVAFVGGLEAAGVVAPWRARFAEIDRAAVRLAGWEDGEPHFVGTPGMSAVGRHMAQGIDVRLQQRVVAASHDGGGWRLSTESGETHGPFAALVLALPAPQALELLGSDDALAATAKAAKMQGCFALMLGFEEPFAAPFDAALVRDSPLSWLSACHTKPGRDAAASWVALSDNDWADAHIEDDPETLRETLTGALAAILGDVVRAASHKALHRWRYANAGRASADLPTFDASRRLALCGDWLVHGRVEAAFLSGSAAARQILGSL